MAIQNQKSFKRQPPQQAQYENLTQIQAPTMLAATNDATATSVTAAAAAAAAAGAAETSATTAAPTAAATTTASAATAAANGGPRVSFNRDVHVKRIGKRPSELTTNYETTNLQPSPAYHQLPADLSEESIRKEAAFVLAQAERHKSKAENGDNIPIFKVKTKRSSDSTTNKFHSLPIRKKKNASKPISRSVSDASAKKPSKRPSIFNIFSRKSDTSINQIDGDPRFTESGGRRLVRSKSDVGSGQREYRKYHKRTLKESTKTSTPSGSAKQLPTQLSPIIENAQKEDYFEEQFNRERRKSEAITDREKHESGLRELLERSRDQAEIDGPLLTRNPVAGNIKEKILTLQAKSSENMHSSQLPAQRLPLTKGVTVNGMVKRLSRERFSPPPTIMGPAFSYIRPNEGITYAQLELNEDQQNGTFSRRDHIPSPIRDMRSPVRHYRSPVRDLRSPERLTQTRPSVDETDFVTSQSVPQQNNSRSGYHNSRVIIESPTQTGNTFSPQHMTGPTTIRISSSHSPSPWQQLSPRNLSDEDEGLGFETRKYFDDDFASKLGKKSPPEPPIVPVIRSITPPSLENDFQNGHAYSPPGTMHEALVDDLGYRRARLESRILTRRFGDSLVERQHALRSNSPQRNHDVREEFHEPLPSQHSNLRYLTPERDEFGSRFHKPHTTEILQKYSPERSHLDIISPPTNTLINGQPKLEKTSRYKHTKYYDDGKGGVKEVYERESHTDGSGRPHVRESRHRERLDSLNAKRERSSSDPLLIDYEPKSLESQYTNTDQYRSSPENMKRYDVNATMLDRAYQQRMISEDHWQSSLKRDKLQQRSFDKGDSGIENDFRKESFNGDLTTRWRRRTFADDMRACEAFLKKERRQCEQEYQNANRFNEDRFIYRERSIDDGSHYDPHLDKYPIATSTLRRAVHSKERQTQTVAPGKETLKRNKKVGGFEKVRQLFTGGGSSNCNTKKENMGQQHVRASSTTSSIQMLPKDRYMVKEEEMRMRYREHRGSLESELHEPKMTDISTRRRLSTPKASPLLIKRTALEKKQSSMAQKNTNEKPEKTSWFKSLDRRSKNKSKEKLETSVNGHVEGSSMKRNKTSRNPTTIAAPPIPPKNLRFFGDTDVDSNPPTISRATTTSKSRPTISSTLNRSQKYSQSAYHLDRMNGGSPQQEVAINPSPQERTSIATSRHKSSSMHNLENGNMDEVDFRKRRHYSRSRDLDDISESGSETEEKHKRQNGLTGSAASRSLSRERLDRSHRYDEHTYRRSNDRQSDHMTSTLSNGEVLANHTSTPLRKHQQHLLGPPKPARSAERRGVSSLTRERDRYPGESSGTEGESSLHSQRSIVYLHATTVGAIPQPYHLRRKSISRDDLRSNSKHSSKHQPLQPMTRTVSRSVSMLAPWKPKHISEGYEINYSQEQNKRMSTLPRKQQQQQQHANSTSTLTRNNKKPEAPTRSRRHELMKDDLSSLRNSSTTSASKSGLSSNLHADTRRKIK